MTNAKTSTRLFVLGATGGIGRELVDQALERHHRVTAFVRSPQKLGSPRDGLTVIQGNVFDAETMSTTLAGHDAVLSMIGPPGPGRTAHARHNDSHYSRGVHAYHAGARGPRKSLTIAPCNVRKEDNDLWIRE